MDLKSIVLLACVAAACGCSPRRTSADPRIYSIGDRVQVMPLIYKIADTEWRERLGEATSPRIPRDRFLIVHFSVTNSGISNSAIPTMKLVDAAGRTYEELPDGRGVAEWFGVLRFVQPAATEFGRVLFDVPPGAYRLVVANDADPEVRKTALVDLPMEIPSPPADPAAVE